MHTQCNKKRGSVHCFAEGDGAAVAGVFLDVVIGLEGDMVVADHFIMQILRDTSNVFEDITQTRARPNSLFDINALVY